MFVLLKGATKEQAFKIGHEIAEAVTATNPKPVKLKFEKVVCHFKSTSLLHSHIYTASEVIIGLCVCMCVFGFPGVPALRAADKETLCGLHVREP